LVAQRKQYVRAACVAGSIPATGPRSVAPS
jgi:hypothetical protein